MIERFQFVTYANDNDHIYLSNPSPMSLVKTKELFVKHIGEDSIDSYVLGGFFGNFVNAFKFKKEKEAVVWANILPLLVQDSEGYYFQKEAMDEANQI